jgi:hypothetical protein
VPNFRGSKGLGRLGAVELEWAARLQPRKRFGLLQRASIMVLTRSLWLSFLLSLCLALHSGAATAVPSRFYTGGAHCCSDTSVVTSSAEGATWTTVDVGEFDGGPLLASGIDGDGRYEFETRDNAFLYTFGCYACSEAPLQVIAIENGAVNNVTSEARFKPAHEAWLKAMIGNLPDEDANGFLAGYVGEKILLGESKPAWGLMLAYYDKASDWGLEVCDQPLNLDGECPGQKVKLTFPDALERMLNESGYKVEK